MTDQRALTKLSSPCIQTKWTYDMVVIRRLLCAFAVLLGPLSTTAMAQIKLRVGLLPFSEALGAVIADRQGYFKAEGIEIEVSKFESGALAVPVLQSGRIDIAFSNTVATLQSCY